MIHEVLRLQGQMGNCGFPINQPEGYFNMTCSRCQGFMVGKQLFDLGDVLIHINVWRCTNCGDITDQVILTNRQAKGVFSESPTNHQVA